MLVEWQRHCRNLFLDSLAACIDFVAEMMHKYTRRTHHNSHSLGCEFFPRYPSHRVGFLGTQPWKADPISWRRHLVLGKFGQPRFQIQSSPSRLSGSWNYRLRWRDRACAVECVLSNFVCDHGPFWTNVGNARTVLGCGSY